MATVDIVLATLTGARGPVIGPNISDSDKITSSGTSQQSDFSVPAAIAEVGAVWQITVTGGNVRILFGADPTAVAAEGGGFLVLDGQTREWAALPAHKCAVITAEV